MNTLTVLPQGIRSFLDDFVVRSRRVALLRATGQGLALFLAWMLLWCGIDRLAQLTSAARLVGLCAGAAAAVMLVLRPLLRMRRRADWVAAAAEVERHNPRFVQRLVTVTSRLLGAAGYRGSDEI